MALLDDRLGKPVIKEMHTYDDACDLTWQNLWDNFDHYYLCHLIDWMFVALIFRDMVVVHAFQFLDELLELSFQHILPHFRECWWDHILVDILFSNTISIFLTMFVMKKMNVELYDWLGRKNKKFTQWGIWNNKKYLIGFAMIFLVKSSTFLTGFFMINSLWVFPKCWFNVYRLLTWFGIGSIGLKEHYYWIINKDDKNRSS